MKKFIQNIILAFLIMMLIYFVKFSYSFYKSAREFSFNNYIQNFNISLHEDFNYENILNKTQDFFLRIFNIQPEIDIEPEIIIDKENELLMIKLTIPEPEYTEIKFEFVDSKKIHLEYIYNRSDYSKGYKVSKKFTLKRNFYLPEKVDTNSFEVDKNDNNFIIKVKLID